MKSVSSEFERTFFGGKDSAKRSMKGQVRLMIGILGIEIAVAKADLYIFALEDHSRRISLTQERTTQQWMH